MVRKKTLSKTRSDDDPSSALEGERAPTEWPRTHRALCGEHASGLHRKRISGFFSEYSERGLESTSIQSCARVLLSSLSIEKHEAMHVRTEIPVESAWTTLGLAVYDAEE